MKSLLVRSSGSSACTLLPPIPLHVCLPQQEPAAVQAGEMEAMAALTLTRRMAGVLVSIVELFFGRRIEVPVKVASRKTDVHLAGQNATKPWP